MDEHLPSTQVYPYSFRLHLSPTSKFELSWKLTLKPACLSQKALASLLLIRSTTLPTSSFSICPFILKCCSRSSRTCLSSLCSLRILLQHMETPAYHICSEKYGGLQVMICPLTISVSMSNGCIDAKECQPCTEDLDCNAA